MGRASGREPMLFFSYTYDFLERYLPHQAGRTRHTVESYRDALTVFRRFVSEEAGMSVKTMTFGDCDRELVLSFLESLSARGCAASTCNHRLAAITSYLWYAAGRDVAVEPVALAVSHVPAVKGPERVRELIPEAALGAILAQPDPGTRFGLRDLTMLATLYDSAIRLEELTGLTVGSAFGPPEPHLYVWGKGRKERVVPLTGATWGHLSAYLDLFHGRDPDPGATLFYTKSHGAICEMSPANVERIVQKHARAARATCPEVPERVYPHMFRRTRATELYRDGMPLELLSTLLGHASVETTKIYAIPSPEMLRDRMEQASPLAGAEPLWKGDEGEEEVARLFGLR